MSFRSLLNSSFCVETVTRTKDAGAGSSETWAQVGSTAPCRIELLSGRESIARGKEQVVSTHRVFCEPLSYTLTPGTHRIVVGWPSEAAALWETYDVDHVNEVSGARGTPHHLEVYCTLRT